MNPSCNFNTINIFIIWFHLFPILLHPLPSPPPYTSPRLPGLLEQIPDILSFYL